MKNIGKLAVLGAALAVSASSAFAAPVTITLGSYGLPDSLYTPTYAPTVTVANTALNYVGYSAYASVAAGMAAEPSQTYSSLSSYTPKSAPAYDLNPQSPVWTAPFSNSSWVGIAADAGPSGGTYLTNNPAYGFYELTTTFNATAGLYAGSISILSDDNIEAFLNGILIVPFTGADGFIVPQTKSISPINLTGAGNTLTFVVAQLGKQDPNADPSGLDFTSTLVATPEPSSLMLLGTGLVGAAGAFLRKRVTA